jgi:hypothetical protein
VTALGCRSPLNIAEIRDGDSLTARVTSALLAPAYNICRARSRRSARMLSRIVRVSRCAVVRLYATPRLKVIGIGNDFKRNSPYLGSRCRIVANYRTAKSRGRPVPLHGGFDQAIVT